MLAAGLGMFASNFGSTLERSFKERVLYEVGTDVRVSNVPARFRMRPLLRSRWPR